MDVQTLVILFLIFSAISSIINRLQQRQKPDESKLERKSRPDPFEEEEEVDWSDWDVVTEPEPKPEPKSVPVVRETPKPTLDTEYREVQAKRPVADVAAVPLTSPIADEISSMPSMEKIGVGRRRKPLAQKKRKRRPKLNFKAQTVRQAIIYNEILGPPRSEQEYR